MLRLGGIVGGSGGRVGLEGFEGFEGFEGWMCVLESTVYLWQSLRSWNGIVEFITLAVHFQ